MVSKRSPYPKVQEVEASKECEGKIFKTNNYGDVVVLEYRGKRKVIVKFLVSENVYTVQKDALEKGLITDRKIAIEHRAFLEAQRIKQKLEESQRKIKDKKHKEEIELRKEIARKKQLLESKLKRQERSLVKKELTQSQKLKKLRDRYEQAVGKTFTHPFFGDYVVTSYDLTKGVRCVRVVFEISGFAAWSSLGVVKKGSVSDKSREDTPEFKAYCAMKNAHRYSENRFEQLKQASDWQKNNLDKCRVRNQNRRVKRKLLGGEVTLEQLDDMFERQEGKCANCNDVLHDGNKELDHIMPVAKKGSGDISNLQWLCSYCNQSKHDKHPNIWAKIVANPVWWEIKEFRQKSVPKTVEM